MFIGSEILAPDLVWQDLGDLLGPNYFQTLKAGECVLFEFCHFFNSENSSSYFKAVCISLQNILIDEMSLSDCIL